VNLQDLVPKYIHDFEAYIPSPPDDVLKRRYKVDKLHRLNNNENPLGPPPLALKAIEEFPASQASIYPSGDCYHLRRALAKLHSLDPDQFLVGNGANEVITFVIKAFCEAGDNIVTADRTFAVYEWVADFSGFEARVVPLKNDTVDPLGMVAQIDARTKLLFICNPNNPTGTYWNASVFHRFMADVGPDKVVVLDEAYAEYVDSADFPNGIKMLDRYPNLVVFRTFSKMYGLAGLRIGYLAGSLELVDIIRKTCVVYSVNSLAQVAAQAALQDRDHIRKTRELIARSREVLTSRLTALGLKVSGGVANYLTVELPMSDTLVYKKLMRRGYMVRSMTGFRCPNHIRVSLSHPAIMEGLANALKEILEARMKPSKTGRSLEEPASSGKLSRDDTIKSVTTLKQAEGIRDLFLEVYGDQYPVNTYYEPDKILASQAAKDLRCAVAEDEEGVCGHLALYPSAPSREIWEVGAGLIARRARGTGTIGHLTEHLLELARAEQLCQFVFAEAVCNHTVTQRHTIALGFVETAIEIDLMPASAYSKEKSATGRVSSILSFNRICPQSGSVRPPSFYREDLLKLYSRLPVERDFSEPLNETLPASTRFQISRIEMAGLVRMVVEKVGADFSSHLTEEPDVFQLMLPMNLTNLDHAVEAARARGFFLGGLLPVWTGTDTLLMQRLKSTPSWDDNEIHSDVAQGLFQRVREDAESLR
jgi:histidinol-phosphate aminotransferase